MEFTLRPWNTNDVKSLAFHANNLNVAKFMTDGFPYPYTEQDAERFIAFATNDNPIHIFAIDVNGEAVGGIGVHPQSDIHKKNAELGYWLAEPFWGNGIITKAIPLVIEFAFSTYDITRIYARPFNTNLASQRVLQKAGFKPEATLKKTIFKNGVFLDELIFSIHKYS